MTTYVDAFAQWDDRAEAFRVYLMPEGTDDAGEAKPMRAVHFEADGATECRLYKAAFCACPKDVGTLVMSGGGLRFLKEAAAKRVAKAVKRELARIANGDPGPDNMMMQIALAMVPRKGSRR